ncbi:hypothetical protein BVRB_2g036780 [Beta vulgaris subsp. vulgaris]|uniref:Uncharacterized protein n=1 Tax=Beta vulgaris subsp. vulgaris TaxID=3555 RepID=A0A0J8CZQ0_BETVV|nr:hypothetical protein BVRB_2g036780 [Beta vulgaris subsp. vulgaris]
MATKFVWSHNTLAATLFLGRLEARDKKRVGERRSERGDERASGTTGEERTLGAVERRG